MPDGKPPPAFCLADLVQSTALPVLFSYVPAFFFRLFSTVSPVHAGFFSFSLKLLPGLWPRFKSLDLVLGFHRLVSQHPLLKLNVAR